MALLGEDIRGRGSAGPFRIGRPADAPGRTGDQFAPFAALRRRSAPVSFAPTKFPTEVESRDAPRRSGGTATFPVVVEFGALRFAPEEGSPRSERDARDGKAPLRAGKDHLRNPRDAVFRDATSLRFGSEAMKEPPGSSPAGLE